MAELRQNTWTLDQWYDQDVAGNANYSRITGSLFAWGNQNSPSTRNGALGLNDNTSRSSPTQVGTDTNWDWVYGSAAIKSNGTLWMTGCQNGESGNNNQGNLGQNDLTSRSSPVQVGTENTWKSVCVTGGTRATKTDGTLWFWGYTSNGQSGLNQGSSAPNALSSPTQVGTDTDWDQVFTGGGGLTGCFKNDGSLYMWGNNTRGQLGLNDVVKRSSPTQVAGTWKSSVCSSSYAVTNCARSDGTIWSWGDNEYGELGHNSTNAGTSSPTQIASGVTTWKSLTTGSAATLAIKTDGTMWSWGTNSNGKGMVDPAQRTSSPTQIGTDSTWNYVNSGGDWSMASKTDGTIWMAGIQEFGQLGNNVGGTTQNLSSPIQLPGTDWVVRNCFGGNGLTPKAKKAD